MNHTLGRLFLLCATLFSYAALSAMNVDQQIEKLTSEKAELLNKIEKRAGGNSTMAYRSLFKAYQPELNKINDQIELLKLLKSKV
jgi:hypothetical protein